MNIKYLHTTVELNLPLRLNCVAALPCKMHSAHRAREIVNFLRQESPDFFSAEPDSLWHPNSPNVNSVDYEIWIVIKCRVYETKIRSMH